MTTQIRYPARKAPAGQRAMPAWAKDSGRGLACRLLQMLREGGARKRSIIKAWADWAGLSAHVPFDKSVELMLKRGDLVQYTKPGPETDDSGPYLAIGRDILIHAGNS